MVLAVRLYLQLTLRIWPCGENAVSTRLGGRVSLRSVVRQRQRPLLVVELALQDTQAVVRQAPSIAPGQQFLVLRADQGTAGTDRRLVSRRPERVWVVFEEFQAPGVPVEPRRQAPAHL